MGAVRPQESLGPAQRIEQSRDRNRKYYRYILAPFQLERSTPALRVVGTGRQEIYLAKKKIIVKAVASNSTSWV